MSSILPRRSEKAGRDPILAGTPSVPHLVRLELAATGERPVCQLRVVENDVPAFVNNVEAITNVVHDPKARVQLLNNAIQSDVALSAKVLRIADSAIHAAAGRTAETCYQAIMLRGFGRMKDIAVGAAVFEHLNNRSASAQGADGHVGHHRQPEREVVRAGWCDTGGDGVSVRHFPQSRRVGRRLLQAQGIRSVSRGAGMS